MKQSLGLLEVSGLALAISCRRYSKAASITLVGLEKTTWPRLDVKITGDVASVNAAIATGAVSPDSEMALCTQSDCPLRDGILPHTTEALTVTVETSKHQQITVTSEIISCNLC